jgi:hypothetical protein
MKTIYWVLWAVFSANAKNAGFGLQILLFKNYIFVLCVACMVLVVL